ncbi:peptidyl-prolyl cis-trans isomerase [Isosphaeraceae bacterium EP7]
MDRRLATVLLALSTMSGCAQSRSAMPGPLKQGGSSAEMGELTPIQNAIQGEFRTAPGRTAPGATAVVASPTPAPLEAVQAPAPMPAEPLAAAAEPLPPLGPEPTAAAPLPDAKTSMSPVDPAVVPTSAPPEASATAIPSATEAAVVMKQPKIDLEGIFPAGGPAARVGDEIITMHELNTLITERLLAVSAEQRPPPEQMREIGAMILKEMIERNMVLQETKRELKSPKQKEAFKEYARKIWSEEELTPLLAKYKAVDEPELKQKLKEGGKSLDDMYETFRQNLLYQTTLRQKLAGKMKVDLPEMQAYYNAHLASYEQPALITWREVVVDTTKFPDRATAKAKAEALLDRLTKGEDFAKLATAESQGVTASKGGLWETSPGGYLIGPVNDALERLPLNQISPILEAPDSLHIVRVESRRAAGPRPFSEVYKSIHRTVFEEKVKVLSTAYIDDLKSRTLIWTIFDPPKRRRIVSRKRTTQPAAAAVAPASSEAAIEAKPRPEPVTAEPFSSPL